MKVKVSKDFVFVIGDTDEWFDADGKTAYCISEIIYDEVLNILTPQIPFLRSQILLW